MPLTENQQKRVNVLFAEVENCVKEGRTALVSQHDTLRRIGRHLDTQKRAIGMNLTTFVLTASIAILGGPITAAVGLGAAIVGYGLSSAWDRLSVWWSKGKYLEKKKKGLSVMDSEGAMREEYSEVLEDVTNVLKKQGLTDVYNAFANMDVDFQHLSKFVSDPFITGQWALPSAAEGHKFGPTRGLPDAAAPLPTITLRSCNDAVELWETVSRVHKRYGQVAETLAMFDEFIMHMSLAVSRYDATERHDLKQAWGMIASNRQPAEIYDMFNKAIRNDAIQKYVGRHLYTKEYSGWVWSIIPDYIKATWSEGFKLDMDLEMLRRNNKDAFDRAQASVVQAARTLAPPPVRAARSAAVASSASSASAASQREGMGSKGASFLKDAGKEYVGSVVGIPDSFSAEDIGGSLKGVGLTMGSNFLSTWLNSLQSEGWQYAHTAASATDAKTVASMASSDDAQDVALGFFDPLNPKKLSRGAATSDAAYQAQVASHIMGAVTAVVKVAIEAANAAWNQYKLETGKTLGFSGMRQQTFGERIGTLRTFAKGEIDAYVELLSDWDKAHARLSGSLDDRTVPGAFLMHLKASQAFYGNHTGQFFEELVFMANEMRTRLERSVNGGTESIKSWVGQEKHIHIASCKGKTYCYASCVDIFWDWMLNQARFQNIPFEAEHQLHTKFDHVPARMLAGNAASELVEHLPGEYLEMCVEMPLP